MYDAYDMCYICEFMKADAVLNLRVPKQVKEALANAARDDLRSMSGMAVRALAEWLTERGYLDRDHRGGLRPTSKRTRR
jgi:hypothetical protein